MGLIVGGVMGGLVLIGVATAVGLVFLFSRRRHRRVQATLGAASQAQPPGYRPAGQDPPPQPPGKLSAQPRYYAPLSTKVDTPYNPSSQQQQQQQPQELPLLSPVPSDEPALPATTLLEAYNRGSYIPVPAQDPSAPQPNVHQLHANWASPPPRHLFAALPGHRHRHRSNEPGAR